MQELALSIQWLFTHIETIGVGIMSQAVKGLANLIIIISII
jgi:hypothetical protein